MTNTSQNKILIVAKIEETTIPKFSKQWDKVIGETKIKTKKGYINILNLK